jgi:hypothetical protein
MGRIRNIVRVCLVWSAALMTPLAGTPHIDCLCPNGYLKRFCLSVLSGSTACCCSGSCCGQPGTSSQGHATKAACCCHGRHQRSDPAGSGIASTPCQKTLAEGKLQSVPPTKTTPQGQETAVALGLAPVPAFSAVPADRECVLSWQSHCLPPPTDLVIALQHFVI